MRYEDRRAIIATIILMGSVGVLLALAGCGGHRLPLADGSDGTAPVGTLGSMGSWILIAGGAALTISTVAFVLLWTPIGRLISWIPGIRTLLGCVEAAGGALILVGSVLEWLDAHQGALIALVAVVGLLVAVRYRQFILRWLRIGPKDAIAPKAET